MGSRVLSPECMLPTATPDIPAVSLSRPALIYHKETHRTDPGTHTAKVTAHAFTQGLGLKGSGQWSSGYEVSFQAYLMPSTPEPHQERSRDTETENGRNNTVGPKQNKQNPKHSTGIPVATLLM